MKKCLLFLTTIALILSLSTNTFAKNTSGDLSQKQALQLALSAREHFWNTMSLPQSEGEKSSLPIRHIRVSKSSICIHVQ